MSEALERVIAEQQRQIDDLRKMNESQAKSLNTVFTRHEELFEAMARFVEARDDEQTMHKLRMEARIQMMDAGWCFDCYSFSCECDHE